MAYRSRAFWNQNPRYDKNQGRSNKKKKKNNRRYPTLRQINGGRTNLSSRSYLKCPPEAPSTYNNPHNSHYVCSEKTITVTNKRTRSSIGKAQGEKGLTADHIKPARILRIACCLTVQQTTKPTMLIKKKTWRSFSLQHSQIIWGLTHTKASVNPIKFMCPVWATLDLEEKSEGERKEMHEYQAMTCFLSQLRQQAYLMR